MISEKKTVALYLFPKDGEARSDDRIKAAAADYAERFGAYALSSGVTVGRTERGKPYLTNLREYGISVSHSGKYLVCALTKGEVGVDIQEHKILANETREDAQERFARMARRFYHPREAEYLTGDPFCRFFEVWTAKESYVKYTGEGIDNGFSAFSVIPDDFCDVDSARADGLVSWSALGHTFCSVSILDGYSLCICTDGDVAVTLVDLSVQRNDR